MKKVDQIRSEIELVKGNKVKVHASDLVEWARKNPDSALYGSFEWDDTKAAQEHRLNQARRLIAIHVVNDGGVRQFVSLVVDRVKGGGYRSVDDVVRSENLRGRMVKDALCEFRRVRMKYQHLQEFVKVFAAIDEADKLLSDKDAAA